MCVCVCVCVFVCVCGKEYTTGGSALVGNPVPCRCVCGKEYHWRIHMVWNPVPCRCPPLAILSSHMEYVGRLHLITATRLTRVQTHERCTRLLLGRLGPQRITRPKARN